MMKITAIPGAHRMPEYGIRFSMLSRCYNTKSDNFKYWGARGIGVCDRWRKSFDDFLSDMGPRPSPMHTLERVDNAMDYEKANCRWATRKEQAQNRRGNVNITWNGETHCADEWARRLNLQPSLISRRIARGWTTERAVTTPVSGR